MRGLGGFFAGLAGLSLLYVALNSSTTTSAVIATPLNLLARWLDPYTPLIPDTTTPH